MKFFFYNDIKEILSFKLIECKKMLKTTQNSSLIYINTNVKLMNLICTFFEIDGNF